MKLGHRARILLLTLLGIAAAAYCFPVAFVLQQSIVSPEEVSAIYMNSSSSVYGSMLCALLPRAFSWRQYYEVLLGTSAYLASFWNSALLSLACISANLLVAVGLGFILAKTRFPLRNLTIRFVAVTMLLPWQAVMLPNYLLARWLGLYDSWLALILVQGFSSFGVFLMLQFMRSVPDELMDAAALDTNSSRTVLLRICCPIARPGIATCLLLSFAESWNMVEQPLTLIRDEMKYPLSMLINTMNTTHTQVAFACCVVYMLPVFALCALYGGEMIEGVAILRGKEEA